MAVKNFKLSPAEIYRINLAKALGIYQPLLESESRRQCWICGRSGLDDNLIPIYDDGIYEICHDHGGVWWNCVRGEYVTCSHVPYWQRHIRDALKELALTLKVSFFVTSFVIGWYIVFPIRFMLYRLTTRRQQQSEN